MSSDEYWFGDPSMIYNFERAFENKQKYDLQMAWVQSTYFRSALASTPIWATLPMKKSDWDKMPKFAENPIKDIVRQKPKKKVDKEKQQLIDKARARLNELGFLSKKD